MGLRFPQSVCGGIRKVPGSGIWHGQIEVETLWLVVSSCTAGVLAARSHAADVEVSADNKAPLKTLGRRPSNGSSQLRVLPRRGGVADVPDLCHAKTQAQNSSALAVSSMNSRASTTFPSWITKTTTEVRSSTFRLRSARP